MAEDSPCAEELTLAIKEILRHADLNQTTAKKVRRQLEQQFKVDLSTRKHEVDGLVMAAISELEEDDSDGDGSDEDDSEDDNEDEDEENVDEPPEAEGESSEDEVTYDGQPRKRKRAGPDKGAARKRAVSARPRGAKASAKAREATEETKNSGPIMILSPALSAVVGQERMSRNLVVQKMWAVIRERNLQDPVDKRFHINDEQMRKVFNGEKRVQTFGMMKYLKEHMTKDEEAEREKARQVKVKKEKDPSSPSRQGPIMVLSPELAAIVGEERMPRSLVVQKMWAVIRERNLQDPADKRFHINDEQMRKVFDGEKRVQTFGMMKYLKKHMAEDSKAKADKVKEKLMKKAKAEDDEKKPKSGRGGYAAPMVLSPELAAIVGEPKMSRGHVVQKMWAIVKERNLKDPKDGRYHICDDQLMTVFGIRRVNTFRMMKYLAKHMKDGRLCV